MTFEIEGQILKMTLSQKNGHIIKTPSSKLTILVSSCSEKNSICNNAHNCFILSLVSWNYWSNVLHSFWATLYTDHCVMSWPMFIWSYRYPFLTLILLPTVISHVSRFHNLFFNYSENCYTIKNTCVFVFFLINKLYFAPHIQITSHIHK